jgi:sugar/nucleoside kinase (ribokinase family)
MKRRAVLVGQVCIDNNISEHARYEGWGSAVLHMAHYLRESTDIDATVVAGFGKDFRPFTKHITFHPGRATETATLVYENTTRERRRQQRCRNHEAAQPIPIDQTLQDIIAAADIVIVAPLLPNLTPTYVRQLLASSRSDSLKILSPQGFLRSVAANGVIQPRRFYEAAELLPLFDLVIFSEDDAPDIRAQAENWVYYGDAHLIMTQSDSGASIITRDGAVPVPTTTIPESGITDSVGCGDVFAAAVAEHYAREGMLVNAIQAGNVAAGAKLFTASASISSGRVASVRQ